MAAIHAGWRGLANGIIAKTFSHLTKPYKDWLVWLGPAISQGYYEVGQEVYKTFIGQSSAYQPAFLKHTPNTWLANLNLIAIMQLYALGVDKIYGGHYCTYKDADLFFSYRREKANTGRLVSLIWIAS